IIDYNDTLASSISMFMILMPVLTMRLFAEEKRQKTDQLLYTSPVSIYSVVFGKFLAASILFLIGIIITFIFPLMLNSFGNIDFGLTFACFLGYFLLGMCFISLGIFISAITSNQLISAIASFGIIFLMLMMDNISSAVPISVLSSLIFVGILILMLSFIIYNSIKNVIFTILTALILFIIEIAIYFVNPNLYDGFIVNLLSWFSVLNRYESFYIGIISVSDVVYYITFTFAFLYLSVVVIEKRRWY
ncbi:MAG: ABC transporter permease, partial [Lachnospirales bacterium]